LRLLLPELLRAQPLSFLLHRNAQVTMDADVGRAKPGPS
jgi:hypothetical protein